MKVSARLPSILYAKIFKVSGVQEVKSVERVQGWDKRLWAISSYCSVLDYFSVLKVLRHEILVRY